MGGGGWIPIQERPRRRPREFKHVASGGVAVGGAAAIWFNEIEITDTRRAGLSDAEDALVSALEALVLELDQIHHRLTGEELVPPPAFRNAREAADFAMDYYLEFKGDAARASTSTLWARVVETVELARDRWLLEDVEDEGDDQAVDLTPEQLAELEREDEELLLILAALE